MLALPFLAFLTAAQAAPAGVETHVLARAIERGEIVAAADFAAEERPAAQARGALSPQEADGMEASRRLMAGSIVRASDVRTPRIVRRGEPVTIHIRSGGLTITTAGRALGDAGMGDAVRVVANSTNRTLDAVVEGSGAVRIAAP